MSRALDFGLILERVVESVLNRSRAGATTDDIADAHATQKHTRAVSASLKAERKRKRGVTFNGYPAKRDKRKEYANDQNQLKSVARCTNM